MPVRDTTSGLPTSIGRFEVRGLLGAGAFGTVYRAFDPMLACDVALKVPRADRVASPQAADRFLREVRAAAALRHPHIVPVVAAGHTGNVYYVASAFIRGKTLAEAVPEGGMEPHRAAALAGQLLSALAYAHRQGVLHGDVRPQNILLDAQGSPHLTDFGLARLMQDEGSWTGPSVVGTPAYMPPEQARGAVKEVGPASDQYSAGVVLYELLTGRRPFEGSSMLALIHNIVSMPPPPPSRYRPGLDASLEAICLKAIAKRPDDRFASGEAMVAALADWAASRGVPVPSPHTPCPSAVETQDYNPNRPAAHTTVAEPADSQLARPPFRARLAADWTRNATAAPLVLVAGGIGGGLAAAVGLASFWVAAPVVALAALLALPLAFAAVPRP